MFSSDNLMYKQRSFPSKAVSLRLRYIPHQTRKYHSYRQLEKRLFLQDADVKVSVGV